MLKIKHLFYLIAITLVSNSCYTYKVYPKKYRKLEPDSNRPKAFVINDTLRKELKILKSSQLFSIIEDSINSDLKIKLYPIQNRRVCGQGIIVSMVTLGQLPVTLPDIYEYKFEEIKEGKSTTKKFALQVATRYWFWDMFSFNKKFKEKAGQALYGEYQFSD